MHYQKITVLIQDQNTATPFSTSTDRNFKYVKKIVVYTSPTLAETKSTIKMSKDFKIGGSLVFPVDFDLYMLHGYRERFQMQNSKSRRKYY